MFPATKLAQCALETNNSGYVRCHSNFSFSFALWCFRSPRALPRPAPRLCPTARYARQRRRHQYSILVSTTSVICQADFATTTIASELTQCALRCGRERTVSRPGNDLACGRPWKSLGPDSARAGFVSGRWPCGRRLLNRLLVRRTSGLPLLRKIPMFNVETESASGFLLDGSTSFAKRQNDAGFSPPRATTS
jgi:hypothetical protein